MGDEIKGEGALTTRGGAVNHALSLNELKDHIGLIHSVMNDVLKKDEHYGVIPGCKKPSLYKSGAEIISTTFQLVQDVDSTNVVALPHPSIEGHREYRVKVKLYTKSGIFLGAGIGSCNTLEKKYRYRHDKSGEKYEHDNPADNYNTCEKMAKKRAFVDAILTVTAASEVFTQDVEDMDIPQKDKPLAKPSAKSEPHEEKKAPASSGAVPMASAAQVKFLHTLCSKLHLTDPMEKHAKVAEILGFEPNELLESFDDLDIQQAKDAITALKAEAGL